jgi:hypothetical protein
LTKKIFKTAKKFLPFIGIIILAYIVYNQDIGEIKEALLSINPLLIIASLSLTLPRILIRNQAWQIILKQQKINIGFWKLLKIFLIGFFYCSITPGFIGHVMRVPYLKEKTDEPYGKLFVNTYIEVVLRQISLYVIITIGLIFVFGLSNEVNYLFAFWIIFIIVFFMFIYYFIKKERGEKFLLKLIRYLIPRKFKVSFKNFVKTFYKDFPQLKKLIPSFVLGSFTWIIIFFQEYIFVLALGLGSEISFPMFLVLFPIANIVGFLPITFAGIGTREAAAIFIFTRLGLFSATIVTEEKILLVSLLGFLVTDIFTGFLGFLVSLTETKDRSIIKQNLPL